MNENNKAKSSSPRDSGEFRINRRGLFTAIAGLGVTAAIGPAGAQDDPSKLPPQVGDLLVFDRETKVPLTPADIDPAVTKTPVGYAMDPVSGIVRTGNKNKIAIIKVDPAKVGSESQPKMADGVLAYSAICTHAGCEVKTFKPETGVMLCPCHGSEFDGLNAGTVVTAPAKHRLAALGLKVEDGKLVVAEAFDADVGAQG